MHWRFELRKRELLAESAVGPEVFDGAAERLAEFAHPFVSALAS